MRVSEDMGLALWVGVAVFVMAVLAGLAFARRAPSMDSCSVACQECNRCE